MKLLTIILLLSLILIASCSNTNKVIITNSQQKDIEIQVSLAKTPQQKQQGLMNVSNLSQNQGMLFFFDNEDYYNFWMKDTLISLDIIFINKDLRIVDIIQAVPCKKDPCKVYTPKNKAQYVLEVNKDFAKDNKIVINNSLKLLINS